MFALQHIEWYQEPIPQWIGHMDVTRDDGENRQSRSKSSRAFWSAPIHEALE